jgi:hypothetical protein
MGAQIAEVFIGWKEWLSYEEYNKSVSPKDVDQILNEVLIEDKKDRLTTVKKEVIEGNVFEYINLKFPTMNSIDKLSTIDQIVEYHTNIKLSINEVLNKDEEVRLNELKNNVIGYIKYFNNKIALTEETNIPNCLFDNKIDMGKEDKKIIDENLRFYEIKNVYLFNYKGEEVLLFVYEKILNKNQENKEGGKEYVYCIVLLNMIDGLILKDGI